MLQFLSLDLDISLFSVSFPPRCAQVTGNNSSILSCQNAKILKVYYLSPLLELKRKNMGFKKDERMKSIALLIFIR